MDRSLLNELEKREIFSLDCMGEDRDDFHHTEAGVFFVNINR